MLRKYLLLKYDASCYFKVSIKIAVLFCLFLNGKKQLKNFKGNKRNYYDTYLMINIFL
ncbi:hypothetical protein CNEO4_340077 [Clostridium neonatale]|nr:hypothetical protein CNEO2_10276 [Clostridium neonatale]CAI3628783.1 hypothetical protein CNEO4_340077 [Clostridium neonatale]